MKPRHNASLPDPHGLIQTQTLTAAAGNLPISATVPANARWIVHTVYCDSLPSSDPPGYYLQLEIIISGATVFTIPQQTFPFGPDCIALWADFSLPERTAEIESNMLNQLPRNLYIPETGIVRLRAVGGTAFDTIGPAKIYYEEVIEQ